MNRELSDQVGESEGFLRATVKSRSTSETPAWLRSAGLVSVGLVAAVAAVVSYSHMHTLAERAGEGWRAWLEPLSVDGLLVGASLVLYSRRRAGALTWSTVVIGILVSLAANLAAARPDLLSRLVAAWPAVALALSYEVLLTLVRGRLDGDEKGQLERLTPDGEKGTETIRTPGGEVGTQIVGTKGTQIVGTPGEPEPVGPDAVPAENITDLGKVDRSGERSAGNGERSDDELMAELRALAEERDGTPSLTAVRTGLRVGTGRARRLLAQLGT